MFWSFLFPLCAATVVHISTLVARLCHQNEKVSIRLMCLGSWFCGLINDIEAKKPHKNPAHNELLAARRRRLTPKPWTEPVRGVAPRPIKARCCATLTTAALWTCRHIFPVCSINHLGKRGFWELPGRFNLVHLRPCDLKLNPLKWRRSPSLQVGAASSRLDVI